MSTRKQSESEGSRYRQVRVTMSQSTNGSIAYSLYAKAYRDSWRELNCVHRGTMHDQPLARDLGEALTLVVSLISALRDDLILP